MASLAISGTRRAIRELADGTVRVQIDIDPQHRSDFFRMFPEIDSRVAIAPLIGEGALAAEAKGGELSRLAAILCNDAQFQQWLALEAPVDCMPTATEQSLPDEERAAITVRRMCGVTSRAQLDHNPPAAARFHHLIRKPWLTFKGE